MVSGLVTSPELQLRICFDEARLISMASKLFMSIILCALSLAGESGNCFAATWSSLCGDLAFQALQIDVRGGRVEQLLDGDRLDIVLYDLDCVLRVLSLL